MQCKLIEVSEALGLCASFGTLLWLALGRHRLPKGATGPLVALLTVLTLNHVANLLEIHGQHWGDVVADHGSIVVPLLWGIFLLEVGRSYLASQVTAGKQQLEFFLERVPASVASIDSEGRIQASSLAWKRQFPEAELGSCLWAALPGRLPGLAAAIELAQKEVGEERLGEEVAETAGGQCHFRWSARSWAHPDRQGLSVLLLLEDFTDDVEKRAEQAEAAAQLAQLRRMGDVGQLAAGAAHDFNNMLQVICGAATEMEAEGAEGVHLDAIFNAVDSAAELTSQMLHCGRKERFPQGPLDLGMFVSALKSPFSHALGRSHALVLTAPAPGQVFVQGNAMRLQQALLNLVVNARDAMPAGGDIYLVAECNHNEALLAVRDTGTGLSPEVREKLFNPFFTTKGDAGTGLGLGVVHAAVTEHGGRIDIESKPGHGTTFRLVLPLAEHRESYTPIPMASVS